VAKARDLLVPVGTSVAGLAPPAYLLVISEGSWVRMFPCGGDILSRGRLPA